MEPLFCDPVISIGLAIRIMAVSMVKQYNLLQFNTTYVMFWINLVSSVDVDNMASCSLLNNEINPEPLLTSSSKPYYDDHITLKFDRHLSSTAAKVPDKFQSDFSLLSEWRTGSICISIREINQDPFPVQKLPMLMYSHCRYKIIPPPPPPPIFILWPSNDVMRK